MLRPLSLLVAALFFCGCASAPAPARAERGQCPITQAQIDAIDAVVQPAIDARRIPGVTLAVDYHGARLSRAYGLADVEHNVPMSEHTVFWAMSVSKTFTASAVLLLAERGQLSLDDPLSRFVPEFPRANEVTIRNLLNQTSGIREFLFQPPERGAPFEIRMRDDPNLGVAAIVDYMRDLQPNVYEFEPGARWKYSNSNYILLGAVIERVSGMTWQEFFRQNLYAGAGLQDTADDDRGEIIPHRARGYETTDAGFRNATVPTHNLVATAGSLRSTTTDLLNWQLALTSGRILNDTSMRIMREPAPLRDGSAFRRERPATAAANTGHLLSYGAGYMLFDEGGHPAFGHIGAWPGFQSIVETYPDDGLTLVVFANTTGAAAPLASQIAHALLTTPSNCTAPSVSAR